MPGAGARVFAGDGGAAGGAAAASAGAAVIAAGRPPSTFRATRRETPILTSRVSLMAPPLVFVARLKTGATKSNMTPWVKSRFGAKRHFSEAVWKHRCWSEAPPR